MQMEVRICSVRANSQAGNIWVCVMTKQKGKSRKILNLGSQKRMRFAGKFSRGAWV